jgi:hypothetical protein
MKKPKPQKIKERKRPFPFSPDFTLRPRPENQPFVPDARSFDFSLSGHHGKGTKQGDADAVELQSGDMPDGDSGTGERENRQYRRFIVETSWHGGKQAGHDIFILRIFRGFSPSGRLTLGVFFSLRQDFL